MSRHFGERAKKRQTTPNVARAKARKLKKREMRLQEERTEAKKRNISVDQLRRERWEEVSRIRKANLTMSHISSSYSYGRGW